MSLSRLVLPLAVQEAALGSQGAHLGLVSQLETAHSSWRGIGEEQQQPGIGDISAVPRAGPFPTPWGTVGRAWGL